MQDLKDFCNAAENSDSTIYLFRYQVSDYISQRATCLDWNGRSWVNVDTNAYFFQETANLDFDIIDVTFSNGVKNTVIPVAVSPIDIIHDATPPLITESDKDPDWLKIILMVLTLILILVILGPFLPIVLRAVVWVIALPFRALGALFKGISSLFKRDKSKKKE